MQTKLKKLVWKGCTLHESNYITFQKRHSVETVKRSVAARSSGGMRRGGQEKLKGFFFLGQWNCSVWHYNGEYETFTHLLNPKEPYSMQIFKKWRNWEIPGRNAACGGACNCITNAGNNLAEAGGERCWPREAQEWEESIKRQAK